MGWRGHGPAKSLICSPTDYMKYASRPLMLVQEVGKAVGVKTVGVGDDNSAFSKDAEAGWQSASCG